MVETLLLSIRQYAEAMNISEGLARLQVKRGDVRHVRIGDRVMIPKSEPQRQIDAELEKIAQAKARLPSLTEAARGATAAE